MKHYESLNKPIIYIDESGFAHDMPRTHGYAAKGQRCYGTKDWGAKGRTNVIGALLGKTLLCACLLNCNVDSEVFHTWVMQELLPITPRSAVIVMDNATFHKHSDTQKAISNAGHTLEFMPAYSPDLNPIEHKWAQAKAIRRATQSSIELLFNNPCV